jgi:hypothetical protein
VAEPFKLDTISRKLAFFADPSGNLIELAEALPCSSQKSLVAPMSHSIHVAWSKSADEAERTSPRENLTLRARNGRSATTAQAFAAPIVSFAWISASPVAGEPSLMNSAIRRPRRWCVSGNRPTRWASSILLRP